MKRYINIVSFLPFLTLFLFCSCLSKRNPSAPILRSEKHNKYNNKSRNVILTDASQFSGGYERSGNLIQDYANLLGVKTNDLENIHLYELINEWMGTPYAYGGLSKNGIDCSGFASIVISEVYGKALPRSSEDQAGVVKRKYEKQLKEGDLIFFSFGSSRINHVGIYLHNNKFAHASTSKGVIISDLKDTWYYKFFRRAGTVK